MAQQRHREETVNTQLAIVISRMGVSADAETILVKGKHRPDVIFSMRGIRVVIEGKFADHPNAEEVVLGDARNRVKSGIAHVAVAAVYPKSLRIAATTALESTLAATKLRFRVVSEAGETEEWYDGDPAAIMGTLRRVQESLAKDNVVEETAKSLAERLEGIAQLWSGQKGACDRLSVLLGMAADKGEKPELAEARRVTAAKVSALVIANALIFQEQLSAADGRIQPLQKLEKEKDLVKAAKTHWQWIWANINYVPIFQLGERVLEELPLSPNTTAAFRALLVEAKSICGNQAALRHDLMGRIYHWLLHVAKYLGTYYTAVSSATLLMKLALSLPWKVDFGDPAELARFKIADLTCGTGTLLMAAAQAVSDAYICTRAETGRSLNPTDLQTLHRALMENLLYGYDVLPSAVHLTASTLAMLAPEVSFVRMNLFVMPMGVDGKTTRLGSLDFLDGDKVPTQITLDHSQSETVKTGAGSSQVTSAAIPDLDLCAMNPPFVRSVGGNLLFGSLPDERGVMKIELKKRVKAAAKRGYPSSVTAGLGSVFAALADMRLKPGGRLAFVLPAALVSGEAWGETRKLIASRYQLEMVIASHDPERPNFSENTSLSEVLFIARKLMPDETTKDTTYINLWRNPRSIHEALDLAVRILAAQPTSIGNVGFTAISSHAGKLGEVVSAPAPSNAENWTGAMFSQTDLFRAFWSLQQAQVAIPGTVATPIALCRVDELGTLGYDQRDLHDAFTHSTTNWSPYSGFWDHKAENVRSLRQSRNVYLIVRTVAAPNRSIKDSASVWSRAGRILLVERVRTNTHRVLAVGFDGQVLGNTWWSLATALSVEQEKALLLWLNSTLGILAVFGRRVVTEGAWMKLKKPAWASMLVLDVRKLTPTQLALFESAYDILAAQELLALAKLDADPVRKQIDDALSVALGLPDLKNLRALLARESGLTGLQSAPHLHQADLLEADGDDEGQESLF